MTTAYPYTLQPQPPPHPRAVAIGGKRGPSGPISIPTSSSEDEDSDQSIGDFSPPSPTQLTMSALRASQTGHVVKTPVIHTGNSPRGRKYTGLVVSTSDSSNNNNINTVNLNHIINTNLNTPIITNAISASQTNASINSVTVSKPILQARNVSPSSTIDITSSTTIVVINDNNTSSLSTSLPTTKFPPALSTAMFNIGLNCNSSTKTTNQSELPTSEISYGVSSAVATTWSNVLPLSVDKDSETNENHATSSHTRSCSPPSNFAYEHDHDYDNVASPCSSTASGPIYVRPPGFQHHAHEITLPPSESKLKKKKTSATLVNMREGFKKREQTPPKLKPKRDPLPMKLRALPLSFWQQPNVPHQVSPASLFPILPPLSQKENEEIMDVRPVTPPDERESTSVAQLGPERKLTVANTDLLFKLFEGVGEDRKASLAKSRRQSKQKKQTPKSNTKGLFLGNDPYLMEDVTDKIFPQLTLEGSRYMAGNSSVQLITFKEGDRTVTLPSLSMEQNYPQMLSELVMHI